MFFNIYNLILTVFKFFFNFFFFLKYITPFLYSELDKSLNNSLINNSLKREYSNKQSLNTNKLQVYNFNDFYKNINIDKNNINSLHINWFCFNKIINQNNNNLKTSEVLFLYSFIDSSLSKFNNIKLFSYNNFSNFQKINLTINDLSVSSRISSFKNNKYYNINYIRNKLSIFFFDFKSKIKINNVINNWTIKFNSTSIDKLLSTSQLYNILFIRNFKVFNKGRYSRNRQYYRTGVYWCLYVNIVAVVGMYYWFYRFTMNFGYLWWLFYFFILTFFFSKFVKYNLFNLKVELIQTLSWLGSIIENLYIFINITLFRPLFKTIINNNIYINLFKGLFFRINSIAINLYLFIVNLF
jgi:hypothetical protein